MSYEDIVTLQGYAKFTFMFIVCVIFYSYIYSLYKRQKTGERDFEKYSKLVLDDSIDSHPLEQREDKKKTKEEEK